LTALAFGILNFNGSQVPDLAFVTQSVNGLPDVSPNTIVDLRRRNFTYPIILGYDPSVRLSVPTCTVKGQVEVSNANGSISFDVTVDPLPNSNRPVNQSTQVRCGLYSTATNLFINVANINRYKANFINVPK